ncbi:hypothetical protein ABTE00_20650, partial [Acinetobacter baumannii]
KAPNTPPGGQAQQNPQQDRPRGPREQRGPRRTAAEPAVHAAPTVRNPLPPVTFPEELPVSGRRHEIAEALRAHQVIIVSGETGSGKTT